MSNGIDGTILLVEDSDEDFEATVRALRKSNMINDIRRCETGDQAVDYLYNKGEFSNPKNAPTPCLVLLDLNLPGTSGKDILRKIKTDSLLQPIPVVVLTTSSDERDINQCYESGANSYIQKPVDLDGLIKSIQRLKDYWFKIVILPKVKK